MNKLKEKQQIIALTALLVLIGLVLLYFYHDRFLPKPVGNPVVLTPPPRLLLPSKSAADAALYQQPDFQALRDHAGVPVKPMQLDGSGNPFLEDAQSLP